MRQKILQILPFLLQKSTIAGIAGIICTVIAMFGVDVTAEHAASIVALISASVSLVAILTQEKPSGGHYTPSDYKPGESYQDDDGIRYFDGETWK